MKPLGFNVPVFVKKPKLTKRQKFLQEMGQVVPWVLWVAKIAPHYPVAGQGRRPLPLETLLREFAGCTLGIRDDGSSSFAACWRLIP